MVGPWLNSLWERGGGRLSDIEYMSIKEFDSKRVSNQVRLTAAGTGATLTASGGKDLYLAGAEVTLHLEAFGNANDESVLELTANGTVIETITLSSEGNTSVATGTGYQANFMAKGIKVAATQVLKIEGATIDSNHAVETFIYGFEEATGASPAI